MSIKNFAKYRPYLIPIIIISVCVFWIVRLEVKASALASRVAELHKNLDDNKDELQGVTHFIRSTGNNIMGMNYDVIKFETSNYMLQMGQTKCDLEGDVRININNGVGKLFFDYDKLKMETSGKVPLDILSNSSSVKFSNDRLKIKTENKLDMHANDNLDITSSKKLELKGGGIVFNSIEITDSEIKLSTWGGDTKLTIKKNGQIYVDATADINFTAKGDINMVSESGSVNLFGKRINFNEL